MSTATEPTALDVVKKTLTNLKKIGSPAQRSEAEAIERRLEDQQSAVNFSRRSRKPSEREDGK